MENHAPEAPKRILVVDDEAFVRDIMKRYLLSGGYEVECAPDGPEALALFASKRWDLVITDRMMQKMTGDELAAEIRKISPHTPIVLATGTFGSGLPENLFDVVLCKPVSMQDVLDCVRDLLPSESSRQAEPRGPG